MASSARLRAVISRAGATDQDRLAGCVVTRRGPATRSTGSRHPAAQPVFGLVSASIRTSDRHRVSLLEALAIVGVQPFQDGVEFQRL